MGSRNIGQALRLSVIVWGAICWNLLATAAYSQVESSVVPKPSPEELARWSKPIEAIQIRAPKSEGPLPMDGATALYQAQQENPSAPRPWTCDSFCWTPSELAYQPLYFDDVPLERYGQTACPLLQPAISGALFFGTVPLMPYKMIVDPPCECVSDYGLYRPGSPTPCVRQRLR